MRAPAVKRYWTGLSTLIEHLFEPWTLESDEAQGDESFEDDKDDGENVRGLCYRPATAELVIALDVTAGR